MGTYLTLDRISSYTLSFGLSNEVWEIIQKWGWFEKKTIGSHFANAIDSISANIAEGFGRFSKKDKIRFYRISNGSVLESKDWTEKALIRNLLTKSAHESIMKTLNLLPKEINQLIKFTNERLSE